jgi:hypothetical protein
MVVVTAWPNGRGERHPGTWVLVVQVAALFRSREQLWFDGSGVQVVGLWPTQLGALRPLELALHPGRADAQARGDLPLAESCAFSRRTSAI